MHQLGKKNKKKRKKKKERSQNVTRYDKPSRAAPEPRQSRGKFGELTHVRRNLQYHKATGGLTCERHSQRRMPRHPEGCGLVVCRSAGASPHPAPAAPGWVLAGSAPSSVLHICMRPPVATQSHFIASSGEPCVALKMAGCDAPADPLLKWPLLRQQCASMPTKFAPRNVLLAGMRPPVATHSSASSGELLELCLQACRHTLHHLPCRSYGYGPTIACHLECST